jgi:hypothetical protein
VKLFKDCFGFESFEMRWKNCGEKVQRLEAFVEI